MTNLVYRTSPSQIENSSGDDGCWRRWWFKSVARVPEGRTSSAPLIGTAFHGARDRWIAEQEPFPAGWEGEVPGLAPVERVLVQQLLRGALEAKTYRRVPGQEIEKALEFEVLPAEEGLPTVVMTGRVDIWTIDGIEDDKTTHSAKYAKGIRFGPGALRTDFQLMSYAMAWLRELSARGDFAPPTISLKHHYHLKADADAGKPRTITVAADPPVTPGDVVRFWEDKILPAAREQRRLRVLATPRDDAHAEDLWRSIPGAETDRYRILSAKSGPCAVYGGCPYREVCGIPRTVAQVRRINSGKSLDENLTLPMTTGSMLPACSADSDSPVQPSVTPLKGQGDFMAGSIFGGRMAAASAVGGLTAPPAASPSVGAPPAAAAPPPPPAQPPVPAAQAPAAIHAHAPPWAHPSCGACRDGLGGVTGISGIGDPCKICTGRSKSEGKPHAEQFQVALGKPNDSNPGHVFEWRVLPQFSAAVAAASPVKTSGAIRVYHVSIQPASAAAPPAAPPPPAAQTVSMASASAAPPPLPPPMTFLPAQAPALGAPAAGNGHAAASPASAPAAPAPLSSAPAASQVSAPVPAGASQVSAAAAASETPEQQATRQRRSAGFTLCVGCAPDGQPGVRLEVVYRTWTDKMAQEAGKPNWFDVGENAFRRREILAAAVPMIVEAEKFGTKWVVSSVPAKGDDYDYFLQAVRACAGTVVSARV